MAAVDGMSITIKGKGSHGAQPHNGNDPISVGVMLHTALQHLSTKNINPIMPNVVNVTRFNSGTATNVVPAQAELHATIRTFDMEARETIKRRVAEICKGMEAVYNVQIDLNYRWGCSPTINSVDESLSAQRVIGQVLGDENVITEFPPTMGGEDFAGMLEARPGCYIFIGGGKTDNDPLLHHPEYDFNDAILPTGASYFAALVEDQLKPQQPD